MTDKWTDRLSEYLDGELSGPEREALEAHLEDCAECTAVLEDLQAVVVRAGSLDDRPPARDLWAGIAERIGAGSVRSIETARVSRSRWAGRRLSFSMPQLAAAALALIVVSGTVAGGLVGLRGGSEPAAVVDRRDAMVVEAAASFGGARYDSAVVELEQALITNRGELDTATVRVIRQNLAIIDVAIGQAREALLADPGSAYLNNHLADAMKRKLELLRRATSLTATQS